MFKNHYGFTLIEMLIVLLIISVLIILFVPNLSKRSQDIHEDGCEALTKVVQAQVDLYIVEKGEVPNDINDLVDEYLTDEQTACEDGNSFRISSDGKVYRSNES